MRDKLFDEIEKCLAGEPFEDTFECQVDRDLVNDLAGYVMKKQEVITCADCRAVLLNTNDPAPTSLTSMKEIHAGKLLRPSAACEHFFTSCETAVRTALEDCLDKTNIMNHIISSYEARAIGCKSHRTNISVRMAHFYFCIRIFFFLRETNRGVTNCQFIFTIFMGF